MTGATRASRGARASQRDALLDAAFETLAHEGPAFHVDSAARAAGASKALVFHHFGTREGLLDSMAARVLAQTQDGLALLAEEHRAPRERLAALADTLLEEPVDTTPAQARHVLQFWLSGEPPRGGPRDALLRDFVAATLREGSLRPSVDVAGLLLGRWHGATVLYATQQPVDFEAERTRLRAEIARALP